MLLLISKDFKFSTITEILEYRMISDHVPILATLAANKISNVTLKQIGPAFSPKIGATTIFCLKILFFMWKSTRIEVDNEFGSSFVFNISLKNQLLYTLHRKS